MEEDFGLDDYEEESAYEKKGWANNVVNCNIDEARTVMICDDPNDYEYAALEAGIIIGGLGIAKDAASMCSCGKWLWITFENPETAMAFKVRWL